MESSRTAAFLFPITSYLVTSYRSEAAELPVTAAELPLRSPPCGSRLFFPIPESLPFFTQSLKTLRHSALLSLHWSPVTAA